MVYPTGPHSKREHPEQSVLLHEYILQHIIGDQYDPKAAKIHHKATRWTSRGHISFENVEMRYKADLQTALRDRSFNAKRGEHVGIVGRTGAGKLSAIQSVLRLYEPCKGRIMIDGVDISTMRLFDLRSAIGVIRGLRSG